MCMLLVYSSCWHSINWDFTVHTQINSYILYVIWESFHGFMTSRNGMPMNRCKVLKYTVRDFKIVDHQSLQPAISTWQSNYKASKFNIYGTPHW